MLSWQYKTHAMEVSLRVSRCEGDGWQILAKCKLKRPKIYYKETLPPRKQALRIRLLITPLSPDVFTISHFYGAQCSSKEKSVRKKFTEVFHKRKPIQGDGSLWSRIDKRNRAVTPGFLSNSFPYVSLTSRNTISFRCYTPFLFSPAPS